MDIYRFINSKDIRAHLKNIGYQFNALEAAWLVYQNRVISMDERHAAWLEIIDTMPDMRVEFADDSKAPFESLHQLLSDYMAMEQRWYQNFIKKEPDMFYSSSIFLEDGGFIRAQCLFTEYNTWYRSIMKYVEKQLVFHSDIRQFHVHKEYLNSFENGYSLYVDAYGRVLSVYKRHVEAPESILLCFCDLWFPFPTPFQKGEIVYNPNGKEGDLYEGPFVFDETSADVFRRTGRRMHDAMDMTAYGYFQKEDGTLYAECMHHYMDLERYPEEKLTGKKRILKALSNQMKGEIDAVVFARAYHQILLEESARDSLPQDITDEGMLLAGLKPNTIKEEEE